VELHESIRQLGTRTVPVVFADDLRAEVKVWVVQEKAAGDLEEPKEDAAGTEAGEDGESTSQSAESVE
jgi:hypothetical protein